jgi:probable HAF family extracellular repeat protein
MKFIKLTIAALLCTSVYTYAQGLPSASSIQNIGLSRYVITDLGTISGKGNSSATGINNKGHVIGEADAGAPDNAFLYSGGQLYQVAKADVSSGALGINDRGEAVGFIIGDDSNLTLHGFLYNKGQTHDFLSLGINVVSAINNSGLMVGESTAISHPAVLFRYHQGQIVLLATLPGQALFALGPVGSFAINNHGQVAYNVLQTGVFVYHAVLYSGGYSQDLGTLGTASGLTSNAFGINENGDVVGSSEIVPNISHAFLYQGGVMQDLGTLGGTNSYALGINILGQIVGCSSPTGSNATLNTFGTLGFVYIAGRMVDLNQLVVANTAGWIITEADGINDNGQIAATGVTPSGLERRALLLTPVNGH